MSNRNWSIFYLLPFFILHICSCEKDFTTAPSESRSTNIYFNSFEFPSDTIGWHGYGKRIYPDAPPIGGKRSLFISGGCIVPHAWVDFKNQSSSHYLGLRCWGKSLLRGGFVTLRLKNDYLKFIQIYVSDSVWTSYKSDSSLYCMPDDTLRLELTSGGIFSDSMLVDMIEVVPLK